jgi:hypothetical protein
VTTSFAFAPLGTQEKGIGTWSTAARQPAPSTGTTGFGVASPSQGPASPVAGQRSSQLDCDRYLSVFEREQFALLELARYTPATAGNPVLSTEEVSDGRACRCDASRCAARSKA